MRSSISITILSVLIISSCQNTGVSISTDFYATNLTLMEINSIQIQDRDISYEVLSQLADDSTKLFLSKVKKITEESSNEIYNLKEKLIENCGGYNDYHVPKSLNEHAKVSSFFITEQNGLVLKNILNKLPNLLNENGYNYEKIALDMNETPYFQSQQDLRKLSFEQFLFQNSDLGHAINHLDLLTTKVVALESSFLRSMLNDIKNNNK